MPGIPVYTLITLLLLCTLAAAVLLLVRRQRQSVYREELSPISRQHIDLFQGGQLNETTVENTKAHFRDLLERGAIDVVEREMRPGIQYVFQVRALAEIGTEDAGRILERQLQRRLTEDQIEQAWYWIDLANGLRSLNRSQSLPQLLKTAEQATEYPLSQFFAAETVCFLGFTGYLRQPNTALGKSALKVLLRTLEGLRQGVPAVVVAEGRLGELVETLWDYRGEIEPFTVRIFHESLRLLRRSEHLSVSIADDMADQETFEWQVSRIAALEEAMADYLRDAPAELCRKFRNTSDEQLKEALHALSELRAESSEIALGLLEHSDLATAEAAFLSLTYSKNARVGPTLCEWAVQRVPVMRRAQGRLRSHAPRNESLPPEVHYKALLRALRGHRGTQTEALLLLAARDWDPTYRSAAISSLGWWDAYQAADVLNVLQESKMRDPNVEVRATARAALARLGEVHSLTWFRNSLCSEDPQRVYQTIQDIVGEGITLLWPDLDRLVEDDTMDMGHHAREALERMGEELDYRRTELS
jgi:HEAT repeat protein